MTRGKKLRETGMYVLLHEDFEQVFNKASLS
jgi:hypothetical protein